MVAPFSDIRFCPTENLSSIGQLRPNNVYCRMKMRCFSRGKKIDNIMPGGAQLFAASAILQEWSYRAMPSIDAARFLKVGGALW
jgi:hypothetical protein